MAMVNVLEAARLCEIERVVWASSVAVFGPVGSYDGPVTDSSVHLPQNVYGASKSYAEFLARHYYEQFRVDSVGLRYMFVYGAGRFRGSGVFWSQLVDSSLRGRPFEAPCGDEIYTWQYVEDAAEFNRPRRRIRRIRRQIRQLSRRLPINAVHGGLREAPNSFSPN